MKIIWNVKVRRIPAHMTPIRHKPDLVTSIRTPYNEIGLWGFAANKVNLATFFWPNG